MRALMRVLTMVPLAPERALFLTPSGILRGLRHSPVMCADQTVVESCAAKIKAALSPVVGIRLKLARLLA